MSSLLVVWRTGEAAVLCVTKPDRGEAHLVGWDNWAGLSVTLTDKYHQISSIGGFVFLQRVFFRKKNAFFFFFLPQLFDCSSWTSVCVPLSTSRHWKNRYMSFQSCFLSRKTLGHCAGCLVPVCLGEARIPVLHGLGYSWMSDRTISSVVLLLLSAGFFFVWQLLRLSWISLRVLKTCKQNNAELRTNHIYSYRSVFSLKREVKEIYSSSTHMNRFGHINERSTFQCESNCQPMNMSRYAEVYLRFL